MRAAGLCVCEWSAARRRGQSLQIIIEFDANNAFTCEALLKKFLLKSKVNEQLLSSTRHGLRWGVTAAPPPPKPPAKLLINPPISRNFRFIFIYLKRIAFLIQVKTSQSSGRQICKTRRLQRRLRRAGAANPAASAGITRAAEKEKEIKILKFKSSCRRPLGASSEVL